jgi:hypothetical protein
VSGCVVRVSSAEYRNVLFLCLLFLLQSTGMFYFCVCYFFSRVQECFIFVFVISSAEYRNVLFLSLLFLQWSTGIDLDSKVTL